MRLSKSLVDFEHDLKIHEFSLCVGEWKWVLSSQWRTKRRQMMVEKEEWKNCFQKFRTIL